MISRTLGAPFGGTTVAGQNGLESFASKLIVPPKGEAGGGRYFPSIVVVASGEPGVPVVCWASAGHMVTARAKTHATNALIFMDVVLPRRTQRLTFPMGWFANFAVQSGRLACGFSRN